MDSHVRKVLWNKHYNGSDLSVLIPKALREVVELNLPREAALLCNVLSHFCFDAHHHKYSHAFENNAAFISDLEAVVANKGEEWRVAKTTAELVVNRLKKE